jgi:hypothetical protein
MSHTVETILEAAAAAISGRVAAKGQKVYIHRRLSLDLDSDELSAHSVDYGEDERLDSQFMTMIDSELAVQTTAMTAAATEAEVRSALLDMRREQHRAIMADPRLGLGTQGPIVTTRYGGASAPEIAVDGEYVVGALTSVWLVHYHVPITDPGND